MDTGRGILKDLRYGWTGGVGEWGRKTKTLCVCVCVLTGLERRKEELGSGSIQSVLHTVVQWQI